MKKQKLFFYSSVFFLCSFLIIAYFFTPRAVTDPKAVAMASEKNKAVEKEQAAKKAAALQAKQAKEQTNYYEKVTKTITQAAASFQGTVGITYLDLTTGKQISFNGQQGFYSASTIKVPLAMLLADTLGNDAASWSQLVTYNQANDYEEGTGIIINNIQPAYSLRMLEDYALTYSDNIAKNMLYDFLGGAAQAKKALYQRYLNKLPNVEDAQFTSEDAITILKTLYTKKATNSEYQRIYHYLKQTVFHERMDTPLTTGKVAHKIGSYAAFIHDMGIFETPHPFALAVFTKGPDNATSIQFIATLTDQLWQLQSNSSPQS